MADSATNGVSVQGRSRKWAAALAGGETLKTRANAPLRIEDVRDAWKVREQAFLRAVNDAPLIENGDLDAAERRIAAEYTEALNRVRDTLRARITAAVSDASKLSAKLDAARSEEPGARARFQLAAVRAEHRDDLIAAERDVLSAERDLRVFRSQNKLSREAHIPGDVIVSAAWLAAILLLEGIFNAPFFFVEGQSLLGAAFEGLLVGGANVGLGLLAGMVGLRMASHRQIFPWKLTGILVFLGSVFGAVGLNGMMAARRLTSGGEEMAGLSPTVLAIAFTTFAAIGFIFAAYKGWQGFFECYPGYGHVARRLARARRRLEDMRHDFNSGAMKAVENVMEDLEDELDADRDAVTAVRTAVSEAEDAEQQARDAVDELQGRARWLIRLYRETNAEVAGQPRKGGLDPEEALPGDLPKADRARQVLQQVEERLTENERAYAAGLRELREVMENLEGDLQAFAFQAKTTAQTQRSAEGGTDAPKDAAARAGSPLLGADSASAAGGASASAVSGRKSKSSSKASTHAARANPA